MTFLAILGSLFLLGLFMLFRSPVVRILVAILAPIMLARLLAPRSNTGASSHAAAGAMREDEAREILGVSPTASRDDILEAHRRLMKQLHPDQGGSHYFATRVNQARDLLLQIGVTIDNAAQ